MPPMAGVLPGMLLAGQWWPILGIAGFDGKLKHWMPTDPGTPGVCRHRSPWCLFFVQTPHIPHHHHGNSTGWVHLQEWHGRGRTERYIGHLVSAISSSCGTGPEVSSALLKPITDHHNRLLFSLQKRRKSFHMWQHEQTWRTLSQMT